MICCVCGNADYKQFQFDLVDKFVERGERCLIELNTVAPTANRNDTQGNTH